MKIEDAIKSVKESTFKLRDHHKVIGIALGGIRGPERMAVPIEAILSDDWGVTIENTDPEFAEGLKGLIEDLKENGPAVSVT